MATGSSQIFDKYTIFGKTEDQIRRIKGGPRFKDENIQKLLVESGIIDSKYTAENFNSDFSKI